MFDTILDQINGWLGITIGGVTASTIISFILFAIFKIRKETKASSMTRAEIMSQIKEVIVPTKVKLNISGTVRDVIKAEMEASRAQDASRYDKMESKLQMALKIMSKFAHIDKLTDDEKIDLRNMITEELGEDIEV